MQINHARPEGGEGGKIPGARPRALHTNIIQITKNTFIIKN